MVGWLLRLLLLLGLVVDGLHPAVLSSTDRDGNRVKATEVRPYDWTRKWSKIMKRRGGLAWRPGRSRLLWGVDPIVSEIDGMSSQLCRAGLPSQPLALELGRGQVS